MLEMLAIDNHWILHFRNEFLTSIFVVFPYIFSLYFYISVFSVGYWYNPKQWLFISLGFLLPFSTLLNCLIKYTFQSPRPDPSLRLIHISDPFGFPSGDVQIATVFWLALFITVTVTRFRYLLILPIIAIAISRVYLGVHSVYDVTAGFLFGLLTLYLWKKIISQDADFFEKKKAYLYYWLIFAAGVSLYSLEAINVEWSPMAPMSIGTMLGFGLSLPTILDKFNTPNPKDAIRNPLLLILYLSIIILMAKFIPTIPINKFLLNGEIILKYCLIAMSIFVFIPMINNRRASRT